MSYNAGQELSSLAFDKIIGGALDAVVKAQNNSSLSTVSFIKSVGFAKSVDGINEKPVYVDFKYPKEIAPYQSGRKIPTIIIGKSGSGYDPDTIKCEVNGRELNVRMETDENGGISGLSLINPDDVDDLSGSIVINISGKDKEKKDVSDKAEATLNIKVIEAQPAKFQDMTLQVPILTLMPIPFIRIESTDIEFNVKINSINTSSVDTETNTNIKSETKGGYRAWYSPVKVESTFSASFASQSKSSSTEEIKKEFSLNIKVHAVQDDMPAGMSRILDILEQSIVSKPVEG